MNIGFEAKRVFQNFTGLGNYSRSLIHNLLKFYPETQAHLFAPKIVSHPRTQFFLDHPRVQTYAPQHPFRAWWRSYGMSAFVKNQKVDVFHGLSHELPFGLEKHGIPKVVTIHDLIFLRYPHLYQYIDRKIYTAKLKHACQVADRIIAISAHTAKDLQELLQIPKEKISLIYQTCNDIFSRNDRANVDQVFRRKTIFCSHIT
ncbi:MAG: glycosyltransferase, partial [Bacteroidota bacterium]